MISYGLIRKKKETRFEFLGFFLWWLDPNSWLPDLGLPKILGPNYEACSPGTSSSLLALRGVVLWSNAVCRISNA